MKNNADCCGWGEFDILILGYTHTTATERLFDEMLLWLQGKQEFSFKTNSSFSTAPSLVYKEP